MAALVTLLLLLAPLAEPFFHALGHGDHEVCSCPACKDGCKCSRKARQPDGPAFAAAQGCGPECPCRKARTPSRLLPGVAPGSRPEIGTALAFADPAPALIVSDRRDPLPFHLYQRPPPAA